MEKHCMSKDYQRGNSAGDPQHEVVAGNSRRSFLRKAAWVPPLIAAQSLPRSGYAANVSGAHRATTQDGDTGNKGNAFGHVSAPGQNKVSDRK